MKQLIRIFTLLLFVAFSTINAHNITEILAGRPDFSTFSHYLTVTRLAAEINRRRTITVCAVDNAAMKKLLDKHYPLDVLKNILSLHVFADYFGAKKLQQITNGSTTTSSMYQATGEATGTSGYVKITDFKKGKVGFTPTDSDDSKLPMATFVKSIQEMPYTISVIQISNVLLSPSAEAPTAAPPDINLVSVLGCKAFSELLTAQGADDVLTESIKPEGVTVFCPSDEAVKLFAPNFKNLSDEGKKSLLLYHGVHVYYSMDMLKSSNGLINTLGSVGAKKLDLSVKKDGDDVIEVESKVNSAKITKTLMDKDPVAVYQIDEVLLPKELFKTLPPSLKPAEADAPGPAGNDEEVPTTDENSSNNGWTVVGGSGIGIAIVATLVLGMKELDI